jgi:hypothetical protein
MKKLIEFFKEALGIQDEFVSFDAKEFEGYDKYDKDNPNRFEVRYNSNKERIWIKEK